MGSGFGDCLAENAHLCAETPAMLLHLDKSAVERFKQHIEGSIRPKLGLIQADNGEDELVIKLKKAT